MARCSLSACSLSALVFSARFAWAQPEIGMAPDTMGARLTACAVCHGARGEGVASTYFPRLAGKPEGYLFNQLTAFRSGRRRYAPMNYLLKFMPDAYLHGMAAYFAADHPPLPATTPNSASTDVLAHGRVLATQGDPAHAIPACIACHNSGNNILDSVSQWHTIGHEHRTPNPYGSHPSLRRSGRDVEHDGRASLANWRALPDVRPDGCALHQHTPHVGMP